MLRRLICLSLLSVFAASAQAGVLGSSLSFNGTPDVLSDDSAGIFIDTDNNGLADVIQGIVYLGSSTLTDPDTINNVTGGNLYAAYSIALTNTGFTSTSQTYSGSTTGAGFDVMDIVSSIDDGSSSLLINDLTTFRSAGTASLVLFTDNGGPSTGLSAFSNTAAANTAIDLEYSGSATSFDIVLAAGFDNIDDFYSVSNFLLPGVGQFTGAFDGAFTIFADEFGSDVQFLGLTENGVTADILIANGLGNPNSGGTFGNASSNGFTFADEAAFLVNPVPEPGTIFAFVAIGGLGVLRARKKRSAC